MGYNTTDEMQASSAKQLYSLMAFPFEAVGEKPASLNDLNFSNPSIDDRANRADQIKLWVPMKNGKFDPTGEGAYNYETFYHSEDGWRAVSGDTPFDEAHPEGITAGSTFWYYSQKKVSAGTLTTSGAVCSDVMVKRTVRREEYNFVSFPYPVNLKLDDVNLVDWGDASVDDRANRADQIKLWVKSEGATEYNYVTFYYSEDGWRAVSGDTPFAEAYPNGITVGRGFWYKPYYKSGMSAEFDITFKSPISKTAE